MPQVFQGRQAEPTGRFGVVVSRYNDSITSRLLEGALATLRERGVVDDAIDVAWVPGAYEIPTAAGHMVRSQRYRAILCLGAVIRGETTHDQHINHAVSHALAELGARSGIPVLFGVLTCDTLEQAIHRSGGKVGNKGVECAEAALEMADLMQHLP